MLNDSDLRQIQKEQIHEWIRFEFRWSQLLKEKEKEFKYTEKDLDSIRI